MSNRNHVTKPFKTLDDQIDLLKARNLIIRQEDKAKRHLLEKNYFDLINGFEELLLIDSTATNKEYENHYFEDFLLLFDLDKKLNLMVIERLEKFETRLKASMSYRFCEKYFLTPADAECYMDISNYSDPRNNHLSLPRELARSNANHKIFKTDIPIPNQRNTRGNYVEFCKAKYPYIANYDHPPFWMIIKTLEFGPLFKLLLGFERDVFEKVIEDMGMRYIDKQKFINSIQIFIDLRNSSAHFQLVSLFHTARNIRIDRGLRNTLGLRTRLNLQGIPTNYEIKLYDSLLVLSQFEDLKNIRTLIRNFYYKRCNSKREKELMKKLLERMGEKKLTKWFSLGL